jgi:DNA-binding transcriptional ArsR family regulator
MIQLSLYNHRMEKTSATTIFESLASGIRLDVYRFLVRKGPEGMVAGEIASALDIPPTNLSFHLKALTQALLVTVEQEGRYQRYRANMPLMLDLIGYLTAECCAGHPEKCVDVSIALSHRKRVASPAMSKARKKVKA